MAGVLFTKEMQEAARARRAAMTDEERAEEARLRHEKNLAESKRRQEVLRQAAIKSITLDIDSLKRYRGKELTRLDVAYIKRGYRYRGAIERGESYAATKDASFRYTDAKVKAQGMWETKVSTEELIARRDRYFGFIADRLAKGETITEHDGHARSLADIIDELAYRARKGN